MSNDTEEIKSRINVVDLIGEYVRLQKAGVNFKGLCPFHNEKTPSFVVSEEKQVWHCFGCNKGGDVFGFLMEMEGLEFREALKILAERAGVQLSSNFQKNSSSGDTNRLLEALELATKFYEKQLWDGAGKSKALEYLRDRGLSDDMIREFRLGFAPEGWDHIQKFLLDRGFSLSDIEKTGLLVQKSSGEGQYDRFRNRILFPISDILGRIVGYSARVMPGEDESKAKYINTPETVLYHKSKALYGIYQAKQAIKRTNVALIVEGNMDVIALHQAGFDNAIAVSGTALTPEHMRILKRYTRNLLLFFDMDDAGVQAAKKSILLGLEHEMNMSVISLPEGKDAAELAQADSEKLSVAIKAPKEAMEYVLSQALVDKNLQSSQAKKEIASEVLEYIRAMQNEVEQSHWLRELSRRIAVESDALYTMFNRLRRAGQRKQWPRTEQENTTSDVLNDRYQLLCDQLAGALLAFPRLWREVAKRCDNKSDELPIAFSSHDLLSQMMKLGEASGYTYESVRMHFDEGENRRAQKTYHVARFKEGGTTNGIDEMEEREESEAQKEIEWIIAQLMQEERKQKSQELIQAIRQAEAEGDKEKVIHLSKEFTSLMQSQK